MGIRFAPRSVAALLARAVLCALLVSSCGGGGSSGPSAGTQTGDEGDVAKPGATCRASCSATQRCCGNACVDSNSDPKNCGQCGAICAADTYCFAGQCIPTPCTTTCGS